MLSQRFALPASNGLAQLPVPNKPSPALSNKTTQTTVVLSEERAEVGLSLFVKDPLNAHTDIDKRFEAVKASLGYSFDMHQWTLTDFVFLDMQQIEDLRQPLLGEPKLSWQLKTGARTDMFTGNRHSLTHKLALAQALSLVNIYLAMVWSMRRSMIKIDTQISVLSLAYV
ncbi:hypothetical protein JCM18901_1425 [Psychrobacter sp. JCM 18901]|uniref:hypothetical protein n=1 Tax=Psychrobacter sp. JCM 18901 TaxID=1298609 RepID=UPI000432D6C9|nr:hypothetical protein [Psychrobacter sp. JCM 18901]GAF55758.1 hypothetical protein JCM18901_1425 [Psychrobacter sp. JCM 18901]